MFGRFRIESLLAEGGMGRVFRAFDTRLHRLVALKLLLVAEQAEPDDRSAGVTALLREARAVAALQHPNIVVVHEADEHAGQPFLVMELVAGRSLRDCMNAEPVPWRERLRWLVEMARGLAFAHRAGVIHRDVKPENVVVAEDGTVKLLDFGIARLAPSDVGSAPTRPADGVSLDTLSKDGVILGTPYYMAPEQLRGEPIDARSDQFAWGTVAYELFAGVRPWAGDSPLKAMSQILSSEPVPLHEHCSVLPTALTELVARTLRKESEERFGSMEAILALIEPMSPGEPSIGDAVTEPVRAPPGSGPSVRSAAVAAGRPRSRGRAVGLGLVLLALLAGGAWLLHRSGRAITQTSPSPTNSSVPDDGRGIAITDLELPKTRSAEALAAYKAGVQAFRDGLPELAADRFRAATKADPELAAAYVRLARALAWGGGGGTQHGAEIRAAKTQAWLFRTRLGERDAALLAVTSSCTRSDAECARKLEKLTARFPRDAELALLQAGALAMSGQRDKAIAAVERSVQLDPEYAPAWGKLAQDRHYAGDVSGAERALERCLSVSPRATSCHRKRMAAVDEQGLCAAYLESARTVRDGDPGHSGAHAFANGLAATGAARAAVLEALEQAWGRTADDERNARSERDRAALELLEGALSSGTTRLIDVQEQVAVWRDPWRWLHVTAVLLEAFTEQGRDDEAARIAKNLDERLPSLPLNQETEDWSLAQHPWLRLTAAQIRGGLLAEGELDARRRTWLSGMEPRVTEVMRPYLWVHAYAEHADSPKRAKQAMDALERYGGIPAHRPYTATSYSIGRTLLLAGQAEQAAPYLRNAAHACTPLDSPLRYVRANLLLGRTLAALGDQAGACAAYAAVLKRWGAAKPRSISAEQARAEARELSCPDR